MFGSLLGSLANVVSSTASSSTASSSPAGATPSDSPTAPSSPAPPPAPPSAAPTPAPAAATDLDDPAFARSAYFQRLLKRGTHDEGRIKAIKEAALRDGPPREPGPDECCNEGCALECVVTMWWEEEKTWRDLHPDWKSIRRRLKEEDEDRRREAEEEAALNGDEPPATSDEDDGGKTARRRARGGPRVEIGVEREGGPSVDKVERPMDELAF
ncbi:hypothetical protein JCM3775_002404 [Rhodotorula graminis]